METLILDLLEWLLIAPQPRQTIISVWGTSCPRLPVWEEVNIRGFVERRAHDGNAPLFAVSRSGLRHLADHRPRAIQNHERALASRASCIAL